MRKKVESQVGQRHIPIFDDRSSKVKRAAWTRKTVLAIKWIRTLVFAGLIVGETGTALKSIPHIDHEIRNGSQT